MGWWTAGGDEDGVIGDEPANIVTDLMDELAYGHKAKATPALNLKELISGLEKSLKGREGYSFKSLTALLANGKEVTSSAAESAGKATVEKIHEALKDIDEAYQTYFERIPTLHEVLRSFEFVLCENPAHYLTGLDGVGLKGFRVD